MSNPLSDTAIRLAKPKEKPYKLFDERGLYLLINPAGARLWRFKYRIHGKEKLLALGAYPDVSLKQARERRDAARRLVADGKDPSAERKAEQAAALKAHADTFKTVANEWLEKKQKPLTPATFNKSKWLLEDQLFPAIGPMPLTQLNPPVVLEAVRRIEKRGKHETAHRAMGAISQVFRYAIAEGRAERDPTYDLRGALAPVKTTSHAAITNPARIGELLRAIDGYVGQPSTAFALRIAPLLFVRPGELRYARWEEFDLEGKEPLWRIPGERMKMREEHIVPLSSQAVEILTDLHQMTGPKGLLFPGLRSGARPISNNTLNGALRRLGYAHDEMTAHGFRAMASTMLNEQGFAPDVIELQLAHKERNKVRASYNRAQRLAERRNLMQSWADYLDGLKVSNNVVNLRRA